VGPSLTDSTPHVSLSYRRVRCSGEARENCGCTKIGKSGDSDEEVDELEGVGDGSRMTQASESGLALRGISSTSSSARSAGGVNPVGW
jgi:hypothetical protein